MPRPAEKQEYAKIGGNKLVALYKNVHCIHIMKSVDLVVIKIVLKKNVMT